VLKGLPRTDLLDRVMRQQAPPTILEPWLAHLVPLQGRSPELCVLTGAQMTVDSGTSLAGIGTPQPQDFLREEIRHVSLPPGIPRRLARLTQRNATGDTVMTADAGSLTTAAAVLIRLPASGENTLGIAVDGGDMTTATLPSAAPAQQNALVIGTSLLDGVPQSESGTVNIGALITAPVWDAATQEAIWDYAAAYLRPIVQPINLVGNPDAQNPDTGVALLGKVTGAATGTYGVGGSTGTGAALLGKLTGTAGDSAPYVVKAATKWEAAGAANIVRPSSFTATDTNNYTPAAGKFIDCRDRVFKQHIYGRARFDCIRVSGMSANAGIFGANMVGQQDDFTLWRWMKKGKQGDPDFPNIVDVWDDNGILLNGTAAGEFYIENCRFEKSMDGVNGFTSDENSVGRRLFVTGCYFKSCWDDFIENDECNQLTITDCLVDNTFMGLSQRRGDHSSLTNTKNTTVFRNVLIRLAGTPFDSDGYLIKPPSDGSKWTGRWIDKNHTGAPKLTATNADGYAAQWFLKYLAYNSSGTNSSMHVDMKDCLFVMHRQSISITNTTNVWPDGTYDNVKILYTGGSWSDVTNLKTPTGVKIVETDDISLWHTSRAKWFTDHGCTDGNGDDFPWLHQ
jgi:hypothetical protein